MNAWNDNDRDVCDFADKSAMKPDVGDRIEIFWPLDKV